MNVSVLVPTHFRKQQLNECLIALSLQLHKDDELIIGFTHGDKMSLEVVSHLHKSLECLVLTTSSKEGSVIEKLNQMATLASKDWIITIDDDAVPTIDWLDNIKARIVDPKLGALGGRDVQPDKQVEDCKVGIVGKFGRVIGNHEKSGKLFEHVDFLKGVNMAVRHEFFPISDLLIGRAPEPHWEIYLCRKVARKGYQIRFDTDLTVNHFPGKRGVLDRKTNPDLAFIYNRNLILAFGLNRDLWRVSRIVFYQMLIGGSPSYGILRMIKGSKNLSGALAIWKAALLGLLEGLNLLARSKHK